MESYALNGLGLAVFLLVNYWIYRKVSQRLRRETMYLMLLGAVLLVGWLTTSSQFLFGFTWGFFISAWVLAFIDNFRRGLEGKD